MGKIVIIFIFLVGAITTSVLSGVYQRSEVVPEMLSGNFQDLGSYALQFAMNKIVTGQVTEDSNIVFDNNNLFKVLDGRINSVRYQFKTTSSTATFVEDDPNIEGEDDGTFIYDITGTININAGTSDNTEFYMVTSETIVDRTIIHNNAPEYDYNGPASEVKFKPKALGRIVQVNGVDIELNMNARYTVKSAEMTVHVWNDLIKNGKAMGHWWITINAPNAVLELDPGIPLEDFVTDKSWKSAETFNHTEVDVIANVSMEVNGKTLTHDSRAGAVVIVSENEDVFWFTVNEEESNYKIIYWNP